MVSKETFFLLSLCLIGGVVVSVSGNHMVLVNDDANAPNTEQASRATIDAIPSAVDFRTDIPDFVPTHEWREVMDGQSVPAGLDIRFDFAKGKKYAKLLDGATAPPEIHAPKVKRLPADRSKNDSPVSMEDAIAKIMADDNAPAFQAPEPIENLTDSLKHMLLELPEPDPDIVDAVSKKLSEEQMEEIYKKVWQKRQQQIADAYSRIRNEASVMKKYLRIVLERHGAPPTGSDGDKDNAQVTAAGSVDAPQLPNTEELLEILEELQKSVEDLDNARDFHTIGGFAIMVDVLADGDGYSGRAPPVDVAPAHFDRDAIKGHAAWVLGTAIKNQADLQTAALGSNAMKPLLRLLKGVKQNPRGSAKGMYALGALLRNHEAAQRHFVELGGVQTLLNLLDITFFESAESRQVLRRRHTVGIKVVALIEDLMVDSHSSPLLEQLSSERCCNQLVQVLSKCQTNNEFEKVFRALDAARKGCAQAWSVAPSTTDGLEVLQKQSQEWRAEISKDDDEDYLRDLVKQADELARMIRATH